MAKRGTTLLGFMRKGIPVMKNTIVAAIIGTALTFGTGNAMATSNPELTTFYHVYIQDEFIGTVADQQEVEKVIEEKLNKFKEKYKEIELDASSEIAFIPEQTFLADVSLNTEEVLEKVEEKMEIQANASALIIDEKEVAYVSNQDSAENVINELLLQHMSEEELAEYNQRQAMPNEPLPQLKEDQTRILDAKLSEEVVVKEAKVNPEEVLSIEDAVQLFNKGTLEEKKYKVKSGDVLGSIATDHDLNLKQLVSLNPELGEDTLIKPGMELIVTYQKPLAVVEITKEVYQTETVSHEKKVEEDDSMFKGDTKVKQEGKDGKKGVTYSITEKNGEVVDKQAIETKVLEEPVEEIVIKGTKVVPSRGTGDFVWPTNGGYVSSNMGYRWGSFHKGMDIARPSERSIKTIDNGVVVSAGNQNDGYGNKVIIDHQNGYRTLYAHLNSISVKAGQTVAKGSKIGVMGSTGDSTGVHLHIEVRKNGKVVDPRSVLSR
ncbi:M23 family metallopeptidase [Mesobacillus maritimus]|uniref:M23 family metallopeptidase n=1 Tax=Mesobacillus maritimus TaxID=1643336 RepID=UPI002040B87C|nr:M23 family metallopeptidase [Mesobacillus maritimus]MCM3668910.1 M23 family metallopeptidase [Mesobacillus maritimus]